MNHLEKQQLVKRQPKLVKMWYFVLIMLTLGVLLSLYATFSVISAINASEIDAFASTMIIVEAVVMFLLQVFMLWGAYRFERWVIFFMWLGVIITLLSFVILHSVLILITVLVYQHLLKKIKSINVPTQTNVENSNQQQ